MISSIRLRLSWTCRDGFVLTCPLLVWMHCWMVDMNAFKVAAGQKKLARNADHADSILYGAFNPFFWREF